MMVESWEYLYECREERLAWNVQDVFVTGFGRGGDGRPDTEPHTPRIGPQLHVINTGLVCELLWGVFICPGARQGLRTSAAT